MNKFFTTTWDLFLDISESLLGILLISIIWVIETIGMGIVGFVCLAVLGMMFIFSIGAICHLYEDPTKIIYAWPLLVPFVIGILVRFRWVTNND